MTDVAVANTNTFLVLVLIVLAAVATGMILYFRYRKVPKRVPNVPQQPPAGPQPAGATAQQPQQQAAASKPFWKSKWFLITVAIILMVIGGIILYQAFGNTLASPEIAEASAALPWLLVLAIFAMICLFGVAIILAILGKKGVGLMAGMAFAVLVGVILVQWLGPENIGQAGERVGTQIAEGRIGSPSISVSPCPLERVVTLPPGESVTIARDTRCSYHLQMRWKPKVSATIAVAGIGNLGPYDYIRYPYTPSSFEYEGVTEELTLTNIGDDPTSAMIFYK